MNLGNAVVAVAGLAIAVGVVWFSFFSRSKGDKAWWAYMFGIPIILWITFSAAFGHSSR